MKQKVMENLKQAMRDKNALAKGVLTILKSNLDSAEKEKGSDLTELEANRVVVREIKQTRQSLEAAENAGRQDLIDKELAKLDILDGFLLEQLNEQQATTILSDKGVTSGMNMGEAMKIAKAELDGKIDNALLAKIVKGLIA